MRSVQSTVCSLQCPACHRQRLSTTNQIRLTKFWFLILSFPKRIASNRPKKYSRAFFLKPNRGLTEEKTQLGIISPIGYFKWPIRDVLANLGLGICSLTLLYLTKKSPILNWVYYNQLRIRYPKLGIICPNGDIFC